MMMMVLYIPVFQKGDQICLELEQSKSRLISDYCCVSIDKTASYHVDADQHSMTEETTKQRLILTYIHACTCMYNVEVGRRFD